MDVQNNIALDKDKLKKDTVELVANEIYDKMTNLFDKMRKKTRYNRRC